MDPIEVSPDTPALKSIAPVIIVPRYASIVDAVSAIFNWYIPIPATPALKRAPRIRDFSSLVRVLISIISMVIVIIKVCIKKGKNREWGLCLENDVGYDCRYDDKGSPTCEYIQGGFWIYLILSTKIIPHLLCYPCKDGRTSHSG